MMCSVCQLLRVGDPVQAITHEPCQSQLILRSGLRMTWVPVLLSQMLPNLLSRRPALTPEYPRTRSIQQSIDRVWDGLHELSTAIHSLEHTSWPLILPLPVESADFVMQ